MRRRPKTIIAFYTEQPNAVVIKVFTTKKEANTWRDRHNFTRVEFNHLTKKQVENLPLEFAEIFEKTLADRLDNFKKNQ